MILQWTSACLRLPEVGKLWPMSCLSSRYVFPYGCSQISHQQRLNWDECQCLSSRVVTRLRALVVLPTRDLVVQVRETFEAIAKGRGLKVSPLLMSLLLGGALISRGR